jgi:hypothetical protein
MKYENNDANAKDNNEIIALAHCGGCNYSGNKGKWVGSINIGGFIQVIDSIVELKVDDMWNLDGFMRVTDSNQFIRGVVKCPICGSEKFY